MRQTKVNLMKWAYCTVVMALWVGWLSAADAPKPQSGGNGNARVETPEARQMREYRDFAMGREGNPIRGKALFGDDQRLGCARCHSVDGSSSKAGPDLSSAGDKFPRRELVRAILEPSATIAVGYGTTVIESKGGEIYTGVVKSATAEAVEMVGADGMKVRIATSEIKEQRGTTQSLMPEGLQSGLSREEFVDVVEYLVSLKQPDSALSANRGMPSQIEVLGKSVELRPFFKEEMRFPHAVVQKPGDIRSGLVWFGQVPGSSNRFVGVHQTGKIWMVEKGASLDEDVKTLFVDVSGEIFNERGPNGLLGMAFHPRFVENRRYFLKHQVWEEGKIVTTVVERKARSDMRADSGEASRRIWKVVSSTQDHSGGCIGFGPDGYLYIAMGDTGPQQDPQGHGQDPMTHLGKLLRVDVDRAEDGRGYAIPSDNPFRGRVDVLPEIWAMGFREPWRFSFDRVTGDLWVGDVGQDRVEEVSVVRRGENHGWNVLEGFEPFSNRYRKEGTEYVPPVFAYRRKYGNSITGGYVYRGDKASSFYGVYICGDYTSRRIWGIRQEDRKLGVVREIGVAPQGIASFAEDEVGNLYMVGYEGMVYRMELSGAKFEVAAGAAKAVEERVDVDGTVRKVEGKSPVVWKRNAWPMPESIWSVDVLDANGDGKRDIIAMGETKVFALLAPTWEVRVLVDTVDPKMLYCVALDADRDGDMDLAVGRYRVPWIEFRQNRDAGKPVEVPRGPEFSIGWIENPGRGAGEGMWKLHVLDRELNGTHGLCVGDVDRDGFGDLIADSIMGPLFQKSLVWYRFPKRGEKGEVERKMITRGGADGRPHYLDFADVNGDGRGDVLLGDPSGASFTWWEQPVKGDGSWVRHLIGSEKGATNVKAVDVNGDGKLDVVGSCGHGLGVFWYEGPGWKKHVVDGELRDGHALAVGDWDGDGDQDVAVASFGMKLVKWYENDGKGGFTARDLDVGSQQEAYDLKAADVDGDGRVDLVLAGRETRNVVWYRNER